MFGWPEYSNSDMKFRKATVMAQFGQKKDAVAFCERWLQKEPENIIAACATVYAFIEVKEFDDEEEEFYGEDLPFS